MRRQHRNGIWNIRGKWDINHDSDQFLNLVEWWPLDFRNPSDTPVERVTWKPALVNVPAGSNFGVCIETNQAAWVTGFNTPWDISTPNYLSLPVSISYWVQPWTVPAAGISMMGVWLGHPSIWNGFGLDFINTGMRAMHVENSVYCIATDSTPPRHGHAEHVVGVFESLSSRKLYRNGVLTATDSTALAAELTKTHLRIGSGPVGPAHAVMADVRIYNTALPAERVWAMYDPGTRFDLAYELNRKVYSFPSDPGALTLQPPLLTNTIQLFAPAISVDPLAGVLNPPLLTSAITLYPPTIAVAAPSVGGVGDSVYPDAIDTPRNLLIAANNKSALPAVDIAPASTTITLLGDISSWPDSGALTIDLYPPELRTLTSSEICFYDGKAGQVLTLSQRGADGTSVKAFSASGSSIELRHVARHHNVLADAIISLETEVDSKLALSGGTMTGTLTLAGAPINPLEAVTKAYVDSIIVDSTVYNVRQYGLVGNGTTDDTVALQALLNAVAAAGGGRIYFPKGDYLIAGPLQTANGNNAQIIIPQSFDGGNPITIDMVGEVSPSQWIWNNLKFLPTGYSIIRSTLTGASGNASMFGGAKHPASGLCNITAFNLCDLIFECPVNPSFTAIDLSFYPGCHIRHVMIYDGVGAFSRPEPTHLNSYGIILPPDLRGVGTECEFLQVVGFATGVSLGELTNGRICVESCRQGVWIPFANHSVKLNLLGVYGCPYGIVAAPTGGPRALKVDLFDIEDDTGLVPPWASNVADVWDSANLLRGTFTWFKILTGVGVHHVLTKTGGINFIGTELW